MKQIARKLSSCLHTALLSSALLFASAHAEQAAAHQASQTQAAHAVEKAVLLEKQSHLQRQFDSILMVLDTCGQVAALVEKTDVKKKQSVHLHVQALRKEIDQIQRFAAVYVTPAQIYQLAAYNEQLISILRTAIDSKLDVIPNFDLEAIAKRSLPAQEITVDKIDALLKKNDIQLVKLAKDSDQIGLTGINKTYRSVRKFSREYYLPQIAEHIAVYSALLTWCIYVQSEDKLEYLPGFLKTGALKVKKIVGGTTKKSTAETEAPNRVLVSAKLNKFKIETKNSDGKMEVKREFILPVDATPKQYKDALGNLAANESVRIVELVRNPTADDLPRYVQMTDPLTKKDAGYKDYSDKFAHGEAELMPNDPNPEVTGTSHRSNETSSNDRKPLNQALDIIKPFVMVDNDGSIFRMSVSALFAGYITNDAKDAAKLAGRYSKILDDYLYGTSRKSTYEDISIRNERFSDIVGREDVKAELNRVIDYICNPDRFDRAGIKVERGYLLAGSPQTGKTLMAKALAGEISAALERAGKKQKVRLFEISTDNLAKKGIAYYMELAKTQAPCILFLDELDLLRLQRDGDAKVLSEFLTSMSGSLNSNEKDHVIILAATNKPENIDFALRQHGRFGKMFWFDKPTFRHRAEFFLKECEKRSMNTQVFDFIELAKQTEGCSFGTLDIVAKKALMHAKQENGPVTQSHFEHAIDFEVRKLVPHGYTVPKEKELIIAVRQASKALTSILLNPAKSLCSVTLLPITQELEEEHVTQQYNIAGLKSQDQRAVRYGGIFAYHLYDALDIQTQDELVKQCKIYLASNVGQKAFGLSSCAFDKNDKQEAFKLTKQLVLEGIDAKEMAKGVREEKLTQAYRLLEQYEQEVEKLLADYTVELGKIVTALQKRKTLSVGEIYDILGWKRSEIVAPAVAIDTTELSPALTQGAAA